jgi:hypothetical protein
MERSGSQGSGSQRTGSQGTRAVPCAADAVLRNVCQTCHTDPMKNGAPFPLITWEDTQVVIDDRPLHEWMRDAVDSEKMPLPPVTISERDRETLLAWVREGAPVRPAGEVCAH